MTPIADTNVLYAFFDTEDAHHQTARKALADPEPILIPREILSETLNLLTTRAGRKTAVDALDYLLALPRTSIAEPVPMDGVIETFRRDQGLL